MNHFKHSFSRREVSAWGRFGLSALFTVSTMAAAVNAATAQERESLALEEVVVSAQKREQDAMEVPITVDVFSSQDMINIGALSVMDMDAYIPGFESGDTNVTQNALSIRGVESSNISSGGDASVAVFYDDVYLPLPASNITFMDMAQIEVLKGPQGTLFGRNAAAGVLNMVPNQPTDQEEGSISTRLGTDNLIRVEGMINTLLADDLILRASIYHNEKDGFIENVGTGPDPGAEDNQAARIALLWNASDATSFQLSYDWDRVDNAPRIDAGISQFSFSQDPTSSKLANDAIDAKETRHMDAWTFKAFHNFDNQVSMKWVSSYRQWDTTNIEDEDGTAEPSVYIDINTSYDSDIFYNELQFLYTADNYTLTAGISYSKEDVGQRITATALGDSVARLATAGLIDGVLDQATQANCGGCVKGDPAYGPTREAVDAMVRPMFDGVDHFWQPAQMVQAMTVIEGLSPGTFAAIGGVPTVAGVASSGDFYYDALAQGFASPEIFGPSYAYGTRRAAWSEYVENTGKFTNMGIYADIDINLSDKWNLILGARYSQDEKDYTWFTPAVSFPRAGVSNQFFNAASNIFVIDQVVKGSDTWSKATGRAVLNYQLSDNAMTFLSVSTGYKSGGFDSLDQGTAVTPFDPEEVTNFEWGIKGDFFDNKVRSQLSVYRMEVDDRQISIETLPPGAVSAIPEIISGDQVFEGIELTLDWVVVDDLRLGLVTAYDEEDAEYEDYYDSRGVFITGNTSTSADINYTLTMDWNPTTPFGDILVHVDYIFQEVDLSGEPNYRPEYEAISGFNEDEKFLNARVAWVSDDYRYEAGLWGKNLLDNQYVSLPGGLASAFFGTVHAQVNQPLTWGVDFKYSF